MKKITFLGNTLKVIRALPSVVKQETGQQLERVQRGLEPIDWKPMPSIGRGVREIRIQHQGQYRVIYLASRAEAVYVLHAFQKKTQKAAQREVELARKRLHMIKNERGDR